MKCKGKCMGEKQLKLREQLCFLSEAMLHLETLEEYKSFLHDILTNQEIEMLSKRLWVAILLSEGNTFKIISDKTGVSSVTIERVKQSLLYGEDGYKTLIDRMKSSNRSKRDTHEL